MEVTGLHYKLESTTVYALISPGEGGDLNVWLAAHGNTHILTHISPISCLPQNPTRKWQLYTYTENTWLQSISEVKRQCKVSGPTQKTNSWKLSEALWQHLEYFYWLKHSTGKVPLKAVGRWSFFFFSPSRQKGTRILLTIHFKLVDVGQ